MRGLFSAPVFYRRKERWTHLSGQSRRPQKPAGCPFPLGHGLVRLPCLVRAGRGGQSGRAEGGGAEILGLVSGAGRQAAGDGGLEVPQESD